MVLVVSLSILLICLIVKRSKFWGGLLLIWLWILFGWSSGNADYLNYVYKYQNINILSGNFEFLYYRITKIARDIGLNYRDFLIAFSAVFIITIFRFVKRNSSNWCFAISLYAIYPFMMDVVQIRNSMALIFIWLGMDCLINYKERKQLISFIVYIIIAMLFHSASLIFLLMLIPFFYAKRNIIKIVSITILLGIIAKKYLGSLLIYVSSVLNMTNRFYQAANMDLKVDFRKILIIISLFVTYQIGIFIIKRSKELSNRVKNTEVDLIEKINIMMLIVIPISEILPDAYRMMSALALVNYTLWSKAMRTDKRKFVFSKNECLLRIWGGVSALFNIYLLVLSSININTVFYPLIYSNEAFR